VCADNERVQEILPQIKRRTVTYGLVEPADYMAENIRTENHGSRFSVVERHVHLGEIALHVPGRFNIANALAAIAVAREFGLAFDVIREGFALFEGVQRRMQVKAVLDGVTIVDDYGHHPTEIRETLNAAKEAWKHRLIVVFQPHRFSRTQALLAEFVRSFEQADQLILMDIYSAGEEPVPGISSQVLRDLLSENGHGHVSCISDGDAIVDHLVEIIRPGDIVMTLGAGNVWMVGEMLAARLKGEK
ncbi:MAG: UDP-N-acetylmuramate--L-alanine ligase, partial [Syntrophobacterales bacterium]|jgi:UDP-N-acetylmuramate--alanine ligase|nr:UDP-N-acetylmuramate--L-alanine ligase [Syntrophobacterales bacterium]